MASRRINTNNKVNNNASRRASQLKTVGVASGSTARPTGMQATPFRSHERLTAALTSPAGVIQQFAWNPGMAKTFSLGHKMARSFEKYEVVAGGNTVTFVTSAPTTTAGRIYMYANYDASDQPPTTEEEFADRSDVKTASLWQGLTLVLDHRQMTPGGPKPIRRAETGQDLNITDACTIVIGAFGSGSTESVGNIYINYNARLLVQRPEPLTELAPKRMTFASPVQNQQRTNGSVLTGWVISANGLNAVAEAGGIPGIRLFPGAYLFSFDVGMDISATVGATTAVGALLTRDGSGLPATETRHRHETPAFHQAMLHSDCNFVVVGNENGSVFNIAIEHADHTSDPFVVAARTRLRVTAV